VFGMTMWFWSVISNEERNLPQRAGIVGDYSHIIITKVQGNFLKKLKYKRKKK